MKNIVGRTVPDVTFMTRQGDDFVPVTTEEIFADKKVIVFSLPGAFTPTCSSTHLPRYNQLASAFYEYGIDDIVCVSVNDGFVMEAWGKDQEAENIRLIPDGNGEFTEGMGALVDKKVIGFGDRSWRYAMVVEDRVITKMFIEDENSTDPDPFEVSDADTMFEYIAGEGAEKPANVTVFTREGCSFCTNVKYMLESAGYKFDELVLNKDFHESTIRAISGGTTVPQVFIDGELIGGSDDVAAFLGK